MPTNEHEWRNGKRGLLRGTYAAHLIKSVLQDDKDFERCFRVRWCLFRWTKTARAYHWNWPTGPAPLGN